MYDLQSINVAVVLEGLFEATSMPRNSSISNQQEDETNLYRAVALSMPQ